MNADGAVAHVAGRLGGVAFLGVVIVAGEVRTFWWLWILYWLMAEVGGAVTDRLAYWQGRYIEALEAREAQR